MKKTSYIPGLTPTSIAASLFGLLLAGVFTQYFDIIVGLSFASEHTLALPVMWTFALITFIAGGVYALTRLRILNRAERLCVLFVMLLAAPLMTQGFWHRFVAVIATNPRMADFDKMDAMNDRLWPHGPNLIEDGFTSANRARLQTVGTVTWEEVEVEEGDTVLLPVLINTAKDAVSAVRITLPVEGNGPSLVKRGEPYMVSMLARASDLGPTADYYGRAFSDDSTRFTDFFRSSQPSKITFLHRTGFRRCGAYGVKFSTDAQKAVTLEFGLQGVGRVEVYDPKLFSVAALEAIYSGKMVVTESEFAALPAAQRANLIVKPDRMVSLKGVAFLLKGYIPVKDWLGTIGTWTSFLLLLLAGMLALCVIMRKQWMDNERYQMPVTRIPVALLGDEGETGSLPPIWKNRLMWIGFIVTLAWMLMKAWHFYNPKVPDMTVKVYFQQYLSDASWGGTWYNVRFEIVAIFLAMCIFMELNVLMSLVVGYFLFRSQSWIGETTGMNVDPNYPYHLEQAISAYVAYAVTIIFFSRKYLWGVIKAAIKGDKKASAGEAMSYRSAWIMLILSFVGSGLWAHWLGIAPTSMLLFFLFLLSIGFVSAKLRTECGTPWGYFSPGNLALFMALLGGIASFGSEAMLFCYIASFMLAPTVFFLIPGAQLEFLELGHRWNVRPRDIVLATLFGVVGGMVVGAWVFLSNAYALGGETMRYGWAFDAKPWYFFSYNQDMAAATSQYLGGAVEAAGSGVNSAWIATGLVAVVTIGVTVLRQLFAGFWFHPVGIVLGSSNFLDYIWGSALTAWVIRTVVLRVGGAAMVRNKLQPIFVGVFLGAALSYLLLGAHAAYLHSIGIEKIYSFLTP